LKVEIMKIHFIKAAACLGIATLSFVGGMVYAQQSHLETSIANLKVAIAEAIQCGGGGPTGAGCKGARGEAIKLMNDALKKLYESAAGK
jgi:hypothetical protein